MLNGHWTKDELSINNQPYVHRKELEMPDYKPMTKYRVTVETSGTDVYEIESDMSEDKFREWVICHVETLPNNHNSVEDRKNFDVINIEFDELPSKIEAYHKLFGYLSEITSNRVPLELLKKLRP